MTTRIVFYFVPTANRSVEPQPEGVLRGAIRFLGKREHPSVSLRYTLLDGGVRAQLADSNCKSQFGRRDFLLAHLSSRGGVSTIATMVLTDRDYGFNRPRFFFSGTIHHHVFGPARWQVRPSQPAVFVDRPVLEKLSTGHVRRQGNASATSYTRPYIACISWIHIASNTLKT